MQNGFRVALSTVPRYRQKYCMKEIYQVLGLRSKTQFYRYRNGDTKLNPAEAKVIKEVIEKYKS